MRRSGWDRIHAVGVRVVPGRTSLLSYQIRDARARGEPVPADATAQHAGARRVTVCVAVWLTGSSLSERSLRRGYARHVTRGEYRMSRPARHRAGSSGLPRSVLVVVGTSCDGVPTITRAVTPAVSGAIEKCTSPSRHQFPRFERRQRPTNYPTWDRLAVSYACRGGRWCLGAPPPYTGAGPCRAIAPRSGGCSDRCPVWRMRGTSGDEGAGLARLRRPRAMARIDTGASAWCRSGRAGCFTRLRSIGARSDRVWGVGRPVAVRRWVREPHWWVCSTRCKERETPVRTMF